MLIEPDKIRLEALLIWLRSGRKKKPREIAHQLGVNPLIVRKWKSLDKWVDQYNSRDAIERR